VREKLDTDTRAGLARGLSYGAFSVTQSSKASVIAYIANQEIHPRKASFQDEFRSFLRKHGVEFDERYVWD
jgi:putative transposase